MGAMTWLWIIPCALLVTFGWNLGGALKDQEHFDGAIAEYREALRAMPNLTEVHFDLAITGQGWQTHT